MWSFVPAFCLAFSSGVAFATALGVGAPSWAPLAWAVATAAAILLPRLPAMAAGVACSALLAGLWVGGRERAEPEAFPVHERAFVLHVEGARPGRESTVITARVVASRRLDGDWEADSRRVVLTAEVLSWLPVRGDEIYVRGNVERPSAPLHAYAFDARAYASMRGVAGTLRPTTEPALMRPGRGWGARVDGLRIRMERSILSRVPAPSAGMLIAITTGSRGRLDPDLRARFANNGAAHVLAVSGLHLGLLCGAAFALLGGVFRCIPWLTQRWAAKRVAALTTMPLVVTYVVITGAPASAVRSGAMALLILAGVVLNRRGSAVHAVSLAAAGMLAVRPEWIADIGFQLSVSATLSLVLAGRGAGRSSGRLGWLITSLRMSTVASLATTPVLLWHFGRTPLLSPLTNLVVVPPVAFLSLPGAVIGALLDVLGLPGAGPVLWLADHAGRCAFWVADTFASVLELCVVWGRPGPVALVGWTLIAITSPWLGRAALRWHVLVVAIAVACCAADRPQDWARGEMVMHAIPVGQGDCTLLRMPDGMRVLIDGGGNPFSERSTGLTAVMPYLSGIGVGRVDVVAMSHPDFDHAGGLPELVVALRPREVWLPADEAGAEPRSVTRRVVAAAEQVGARVRVFRMPYVVGSASTRIEVAPAAPGLDVNNGGLVLRSCHHDVCYLLPGDIEHEREAALLQSSIPLRADVLKVPHHGSLTSSTPAFLDRVGARVALFHVGEDNRFRFPRPQVVERYDARGVRSFRTDRGAIRVASDGYRITVRGRW